MTGTWSPLHGHTYYSFLDGLSKPKLIAKRCANLGYPAVAMTDHGNIGASVEFTKAMRSVGIKPILGVEAYLSRHNPSLEKDDPSLRPRNGRPYSHLVVLAKNLAGWKQVIRAVSLSWSKDHFYYNPRLSLDNFEDLARDRNLIAFSGHPGSDLGNVFFTSPKAAYACRDDATVKEFVDPDWSKKAVALVERYVSVFGRENFFIEVQVLNPDSMPASAWIAKGLRWLSKATKIPCVATADSHYVERVDAYDQRTLLCSKLRTTHAVIQQRIANEEDIELGGFFQGDHFHIPSLEEMQRYHKPREIEQANRIAEMCEDYDILSQPRLPAFPCPPGFDEKGFLRSLCEDGFRRLIDGREAGLEYGVSEYRDRLNMELEVIEGAGLPAYFLIVQDCTNYGRERGWLLGTGRGSGAGCLVSYLTGITSIDPLPYGLLFERFYNAGRNKPGHVSLPDIDMDFPVIKRDEIFRHLQAKFGADKVAKIATFQSLQGRSAIDEVLAAHAVGFDERKTITKIIPDPARISEELQDMKERGEEPSVIQYSLETYADELAEWVRLNDDGSLSGDYASYFAQAKRLEGTKKNISTHAAGVVISSEPLAGLCPLKYEKADDAYIAAMEYPALEAMGLVKLDLLGVAMLNKGEGVRELALTGEITCAT